MHATNTPFVCLHACSTTFGALALPSLAWDVDHPTHEISVCVGLWIVWSAIDKCRGEKLEKWYEARGAPNKHHQCASTMALPAATK